MEKSKHIGTLELEGMQFRAYHGCLEREKIAGNDFVVDFRGELDMTAAAESDRLEDAVNYLVASHPSWDLDSELVYRFMMALRRKIN